MADRKKELAKLLQANSYRHRLFHVFSDFCELSAIAISNSFLMNDSKERRYLDIIKQYEPEEVKRFPIMLGLLVQELEKKLSDILGFLYMELELGSDRAGQFFTPYHLSAMIAKMSYLDMTDKIKAMGFITVQEPAAGAGGMIIALAQAMLDEKTNYQQAMHVTAIDIDSLCVHMCYLQLSLIGVPAVILHGNTLSNEMYAAWKTPMHYMGNWDYKLRTRANIHVLNKSY